MHPGHEGTRLRAETIHAGVGAGTLLLLDAPLSLWGGTDLRTGTITDTHHPQCGVSLASRVVAMPGGRGSSSSSSVLAEQIRSGVAPAALLLTERDAILALGAIVAAELYELRLPIALLTAADYAALPATPAHIRVDATGHRADLAFVDASAGDGCMTSRSTGGEGS